MDIANRNLRILCVQYANPASYPPLEHGSLFLADAGMQVTFLSIAPFGSEDLALPSHPRVRVRRMFRWPFGVLREIHYLLFCFWVIASGILQRPRWVYASDGFSCLPGWLLSFVPGVKVVYHEHDSPPPSARHLRRARKRLAQRAVLCVFPNARRAERFSVEARPPRPPVLVWNCPRLEEVRPPRKVFPDGLRLYYHGSLVPSRLPLSLLHALKELPDSVTLKVVGYYTIGWPAYGREFWKTAKGLALERRVEVIGAVPKRSEVFRHAESCDVGISFMPKSSLDWNDQSMEGASNKPFDYLACGMPLLVSKLPGWETTYVRTGYGLSCDPEDPASLQAALRWFLEHPEERIAMGEAGRQRILKDWNYENQFKPVFDRIVTWPKPVNPEVPGKRRG